MSETTRTLAGLGRYAFAFALIGFGCWGVSHETAPKLTDPHVLMIGVGLLIVPFFPGAFAGAVEKVGAALAQAWKAKKDAEK